MTPTKDNITFTNIRDLRPFGINPLTGEACAYGLRQLCDLTRDGKKTLEAFYGSYITSPNWNCKVGETKAEFSCMISRSTFEDLMKFIIWREGCKYMTIKGNVITGFVDLDDEQKAYVEKTGGQLYCSPVSQVQPQVDGRNVHQATGRTQ